MLKALFVLQIFTFLSCVFGYIEKWFDKKLIRQLQHILPHISRSKDSKTKKFGLLNNITRERLFLKNHTQNVVGNLVPDPFIKIKIEHISGSTI